MQLTDRFHALDQILQRHREYWQFMPFQQRGLPWGNSHPELCNFLNSLRVDELEDTEPDRWRSALATYLPELKDLPELLHIPQSSETPWQAPFWLSSGIKGRKWQQIQHFAPLAEPAQQHLEWCAGKGHLGRLVGYKSGTRIDSVEIQADLCQQGEELAQQHQVSQHFHCRDVLKDDLASLVGGSDNLVALHACGDLHVKLLQLAVENQAKALLLSPCCYQKTQAQYYRPLSKFAANSSLKLSRDDLKLSVQETVTAGKRESRQRQQEQLYRLAFDVLQRQIRNQDTYLPVPSTRGNSVTADLATFCHWAASQKHLSLDGVNTDWNALLIEAQVRQQAIQRMAMVQHQFRRSIELWLVLDRCLYLEENGFDVNLQEFCQRELTPRNLAIRANKKRCC